MKPAKIFYYNCVTFLDLARPSFLGPLSISTDLLDLCSLRFSSIFFRVLIVHLTSDCFKINHMPAYFDIFQNENTLLSGSEAIIPQSNVIQI